MTARAEVMCTLCGATSTVLADDRTAEGLMDALAWAQHFASQHPWLSTDAHVRDYLVMVEAGDAPPQERT